MRAVAEPVYSKPPTSPMTGTCRAGTGVVTLTRTVQARHQEPSKPSPTVVGSIPQLAAASFTDRRAASRPAASDPAVAYNVAASRAIDRVTDTRSGHWGTVKTITAMGSSTKLTASGSSTAALPVSPR